MGLSRQMIELKYILPYAASFFGLMVSFCALLMNRSLFIHRIFAAGMMILAAESLFTGLAVNATASGDVLYWLSLRNLLTALVPGIWLVFSLCFSSVDYREQLAKRKWLVAALFVLPLSIALYFRETIYSGHLSLIPLNLWTIPLERAGFVFQLLILFGVIAILFNIERVLRHSTGHFRWKIKFMVLGIGFIFATRIYSISQALLFKSVKMELELVNDAALILGIIMMAVSFYRMRSLDIRFYMSDTLIYNSLSILFIGAYFIAVGVVAKLSFWLGDGHELAIRAFFILLALAGLMSLFLSNKLKKRLKKVVNRHLKRPVYDYRREWAQFTMDTTSVMDIQKLCNNVVQRVSKTFDILSVTIWTLDESEKDIKMVASTVFSQDINKISDSRKNQLMEFIEEIKNKHSAYDADYLVDELPGKIRDFDQSFFDELMIRYCIPLIAGGSFLGVMALHKAVGNKKLTLEDFDLLKTMADQLASNMLNIMLAKRLRKAKQMEAFQRMSAFFVHDLKNLASNLSLTMQNLPKHFANPEFRKDALDSLAQSVDKIGFMCGRLTSMSQKTDLTLQPTDVNRIVSNVLSGMNGAFGQKIIKKLEPVPKVNLDPEQFPKVVANLMLNAHEATGQDGNITISTEHKNGWVSLTVQDNGKGMTQDFIEKSLFQPFETTKPRGIGIGLYHTKSIVESHNAKIEVESEPGKGSKFSVLLPVSGDP
jgi:putative PEP-CTERM system histidine kinase